MTKRRRLKHFFLVLQISFGFLLPIMSLLLVTKIVLWYLTFTCYYIKYFIFMPLEETTL